MKSVDPARLAALFSARAQLPANAPAKPAPWAAAAVRFDFGGGKPDPASLPYAEIADATRRLLEGPDGPASLTYGALAGADSLRDVVVEKHARREALAISRDEVFVTNGSSQALAILADALLDPGDAVVVEAPSFSGSLAILRKRGAEIFGVPLDDAGLRTDALEETLRDLAARGRRAKLIYTIDYFQNPTGVTLAVERRRELLRIAAEHGALVVEDEAYGDLRYDGANVPSLYALDETGTVVRMGTFSKILAAGFRLGWVLAAPELVQRLQPLKQDWGTNPFVCRVAATFLRERMDAHVERLVGVYRAKRDAMLAGLASGLGADAAWTRPEGGFFIWLRLPDGTNPERLLDLAIERQVSFVGGSAFYPNGEPAGEGREFIRLAFSFADVPAISEGTARLCEAIRLAR